MAPGRPQTGMRARMPARADVDSGSDAERVLPDSGPDQTRPDAAATPDAEPPGDLDASLGPDAADADPDAAASDAARPGT